MLIVVNNAELIMLRYFTLHFVKYLNEDATKRLIYPKNSLIHYKFLGYHYLAKYKICSDNGLVM